MRVARGARVLCVWTTVLCSAVAAARGQPVHDARGEALRLYEAGRFAEALPLFDQVLARQPRDIDALNKRGCIYLRMNRPELAIRDLDMATNENMFLAYDAAGLDRQFAPDVVPNAGSPRFWGMQLYVSAFTNRGVAKMMLGRDDEALADFQHAVDLRRLYRIPPFNPAYEKWRVGMAASYCGIGQVSLRRNNPDGAIDAFNEAIGYNPEDPNGFVGRGRAMAALGRFQEALNDYNEALRLDPNHARALGYRAATLADVGRALEAVGDLDRSIKLDPKENGSRRLRAAFLARLGRYDEAFGELAEALRLNPREAAVLKDRGGLYSQLGQPAKALPDLDAAIALDPNSAKAYQNRAGTHNALGRYAEAVRDADAALRLDAKNAGALNNRGLARLGLGEYEPAVADLTEAIALDEQLASAYLNRGGALMMLGRHDEAAADYALAVRLQPRLAKAYSSPSAIPELLRITARPVHDDLAVRQVPAPGRSFCDRGDVRRAAGDWEGAIAEYTRAIEADPAFAEALALRGWAKLCGGVSGAVDDVRAWFSRASWRDPFAPSVALLGVLASRRDGHDAAAAGFLDEVLANLRPADWPAPVFRYLKRQITDQALVSVAAEPEKITLARAVVGFDLWLRGYRDAALDQFRWVRDHGVDRSIARDLAVETLRRTEAAGATR
jgi:tetratricopeptide (TPR) repeat protein